MDFITMLQCWLIVYGLSFSLALTDGPFGLFSLFRKTVKENAERDWIRNGVSCPVCVSFSLSAIFACCFASGVWEWSVLWLTSFGFTCTVTSLSPE